MVYASGGKLISVKNAGIAGERSGQILARFDTDVAPFLPATVFILMGANDLADVAYTRAMSVANLDAAITKVRNKGGTPIVLSICPNTVSRAKVAAYNRAYATLCERRMVRYVDIYTTMTDPTTGTFRTGYSADGTHPERAGIQAMATATLAQIDDLIGGSAMLCVDNTDSANLLAGGLFLTDTNTDGVANSWTGVNVAAGFVNDIVTGDPAIQGNWQRITMTAGASYRTIQQTVAVGANVAVGDTVRLSCRVAVTGLTNQAVWSVGWLTGAGNVYQYVVQNANAPCVGVIERDFVVPVGTTFIGLHFQIKSQSGGSSDGVIKVAQAGLYNMTTAGGLL
jgi:lysophospholipase L1-like esterase